MTFPPTEEFDASIAPYTWPRLMSKARELVGIDVHLILANEAPHARDLRHSGDVELVAHVPVLDRPELSRLFPSPSTVYEKTCPRALASDARYGTTPAGRKFAAVDSFSRTRWRAK
jgi:hypothetical protein